jgi:hypothetical protein
MKTIIVVYTQRKLDDAELRPMDKYAYMTSEDVKPGDMFMLKHKTSYIQVVEVLEKEFSFVNLVTGDLKNERTSTKDAQLSELVINAPSRPDVVYATRAA